MHHNFAKLIPLNMMLIETWFLFQERIDVKAFNSDGSYYKLSAVLNMTADRTKVGESILLITFWYELLFAVSLSISF